MASYRIPFFGLAAVAVAALIGWMLLTGATNVENAKARTDPTTEATLARTGAKEIPSDPKLSVEPAGYR